MDLRDFIINFCLDQGFQPKDLIYLKFNARGFDYKYIKDNGVAFYEESVKWDF